MKLWHLYVAIGLVALVLTAGQAFQYADLGFVGANVRFWSDAWTGSPASRFLVYDVLFLGLAVFVLMAVEARRVGIKPAWLVVYVLGSVLVGISAFVPFYLAHRQRRLDAQTGSE